jgi:AcrR family transcriptional regulator
MGDREAKRGELLKAAISVIARDGYAGASLRKVAQHAGCTTGAVTYYFANKEAMMVAVAESLFDTWDTILTRNSEPIDTRAELRRWFEWTNAEDPDPWLAQFQLLGPARNEPALAAVYQRRYAQFRHALAEGLARGQSHGVVRNDVPADLLADQLSAMGDGWMITFPIEPQRYTPERMQALIEATLTLLSPPRAP